MSVGILASIGVAASGGGPVAEGPEPTEPAPQVERSDVVLGADGEVLGHVDLAAMDRMEPTVIRTPRNEIDAYAVYDDDGTLVGYLAETPIDFVTVEQAADGEALDAELDEYERLYGAADRWAEEQARLAAEEAERRMLEGG